MAGQYLIKGQEAFFEGRLQTRTYTGKDNVERRVTEIVADTMQFGAKPAGAAANNNQQTKNQAAGAPVANQAQPNNEDTSQQNTQEEDIPTINLDEEKEDVKIEDVPF